MQKIIAVNQTHPLSRKPNDGFFIIFFGVLIPKKMMNCFY